MVCLQNRSRISYLYLEHTLEDTGQKIIPPQRTQDFIPFRTPNKMKKKKKTLLLWEHLHFISSSKTLMAREELCQLSLALLYSWELPSMGTRFRFFWKRQAEHRARAAQRRTYSQVHPDTSPSSSQLLTDRHRRKTFL